MANTKVLICWMRSRIAWIRKCKDPKNKKGSDDCGLEQNTKPMQKMYWVKTSNHDPHCENFIEQKWVKQNYKYF